jgi:CheY-like chemotaxis protein
MKKALTPNTAVRSTTGFGDDPNYNILIAEGDKNHRLALYDMLEANDLWNIFSSTNAQETIEVLKNIEVDLDLVLLGFNMIEMFGLDVLAWMRDRPKFQNIPVVMMCTEDDVKNLSYCLEKGAADYMVKPIRVPHIRALDKYIAQGPGKQKKANSCMDYEKVRTLGRGAFGLVDLVTSKKDLELYAMKILPMFHFDESKKKAAQNEIRLLKVLDSPYVVKYYEHFVKNGNMYIIMEYCEGNTIDDKIQEFKIAGKTYFFFINNKSFENEQVKTWFAQLVLAMMLFHSKNILHRDLKLQNMFLTKDNTLKLGDFGIARSLEENSDFASTMCGTPYYMAPEVFGGQPYNSKADIFA